MKIHQKLISNQTLKKIKNNLKMTICLVIQKDTLENNKVKSVLKSVPERPEDFISELQEGHCIPYQLVAHTKDDPILLDSLITTVSNSKTSYGKDWYELDMETLSEVISLFLKSGKTVIDFTTISSIFGFTFNVFPVVTKEIKIERRSAENRREDSRKDTERKDTDKKETKKEKIANIIENLQEEPRRKKKSSSKKE